MTPCPCGRYPLYSGQYTCPNCYGPVEDSSDLELLRGWGDTEREAALRWSEAVAEYIDQRTSSQLRQLLAVTEARIDLGAEHSGDRVLARMVRDVLTIRHHECEETIPPPPSLPREERDTVRPARMRETGAVLR